MDVQERGQCASPLWQDKTSIPMKIMIFVSDSDFHSSSLQALVILYLKYTSSAFKNKVCCNFCGSGMDYFGMNYSYSGSDNANFLPIPTSHGVGISHFDLRVYVVQSVHLTVK